MLERVLREYKGSLLECLDVVLLFLKTKAFDFRRLSQKCVMLSRETFWVSLSMLQTFEVAVDGSHDCPLTFFFLFFSCMFIMWFFAWLLP